MLRSVFIKEYDQNMYGVIPFFLSKNLIQLIDEIFSTILFTLIVYWGSGLDREFDKYVNFCKLYFSLRSFVLPHGWNFLWHDVWSSLQQRRSCHCTLTGVRVAFRELLRIPQER